MAKMLIADDNKQITSILSNYARKEGFEPVVALDGEEALRLFDENEADIAMVLLDVMMPKMDGFEVCRQLRSKSLVPVIMVTARGEDFEKIMGLDIGADDYIIKPFSAGEVMARVRAILRRMQPREEKSNRNTYSYDNLLIDLDKYAVTVGGSEVALTKKEVELLWTLAKTAARFSRGIICWIACGATIITATAALLIRILSVCAPSWINLSIPTGRLKPSGV